ncbi:MAG: 2-C-methyl-D-erythritol 2,4-cyclodiphosphate synthase [Firmicutes bacterium]|nr:2-C-methyl-D-erythritol 2,4-cyclodiphosphate synthase [Bacillota bacterium]
MVVERSGIKVRVLEDRLDNIKITYREDLAVAETYLAAYNKIDGNNVPNHDYPGQRKFKVGIGFDIHKLVPGRRLILGGVDIPFNLGLEGHSDADVVFHAIADAILGACALGDIGVIFPPTDPSYKGISSGVILSEVVRLAKERGYIVNNVDITVLAEKPKISKFACKMRKNISDFLEIAGEDVGIKATTMEGLGVIGSAEGIACFASCSLIL